MEYLFVWYVWLALALLTLILEILLPGFVIACFSVGAAVAAIVAAFGAGVNAQLIVFAAVTLGVFAFIRPFALKYLMRNPKNRITTNHDALPDRIGRVVTAINNESMKGRVKVDGDVFMARSADGMPISEGNRCENRKSGQYDIGSAPFGWRSNVIICVNINQ